MIYRDLTDDQLDKMDDVKLIVRTEMKKHGYSIDFAVMFVETIDLFRVLDNDFINLLNMKQLSVGLKRALTILDEIR